MRPRTGIQSTLTLALLALFLGGCQTNTSLRESGEIDFNRGQYAMARDKFSRAIEMADSDYRSLYWLGITQLKLEKPVAAQVSLERALAIRADDPELTPKILDGLAESYYQQDRPENLAAFLKSATEDYATSYDYQRQGKYLAKIGDLDNARLALRKGAFFARPNDAQPYLAIADFFRTLSDHHNELIALRYAYYVNPKTYGLDDRLRSLGVVPGPTVALQPPKPSELLK